MFICIHILFLVKIISTLIDRVLYKCIIILSQGGKYMIKPLYNNVLLKKEKALNETKSGIILSQKEKDEDYAVVVAVSDLKEVKINDKVYTMPLKAGDKVMYKKYSGTNIKDNDEEYILISAEDILAIVE